MVGSRVKDATLQHKPPPPRKERGSMRRPPGLPQAGLTSRAFSSPAFVFLVTVTIRLTVFVFLPEIEAVMGTDVWVAHPSLPPTDGLPQPDGRGAWASIHSRWIEHPVGNGTGRASRSAAPWLRPFKRATPRGAFFSHDDAEEVAPSFPFRFSSTIPPLEATVWRDVVFLKQRLLTRARRMAGEEDTLESMDVLLPDYLRSLAPWYAQHIPPSMAQQPWAVLVLTLFDGVVAAAYVGFFPSTDTALLLILFVANPFTIAACVYESLQPLEMLLLTFIVVATRRAGRWSHGDDDAAVSSAAASSPLAAVGRVVLRSAAVAASLFLGSSYLSVTVALLFPVGMRSRWATVVAASVLTAFVGLYALAYGFLDTHEKLRVGEVGTGSALTAVLGLHDYARKAERSTLYAPIDNGVLWYVRQVVLPAFEENLALVLLQVPAMMMIPLCMLLPDVGCYMDAYKRMRAAGKGGAVSDRMIEPLYKDTKVFAVIFSILASFLFRSYFNLVYMFFGVLLIYSNACGETQERVLVDADSEVAPAVRSMGSRSRERELATAEAQMAHVSPAAQSAQERAKIIVPLYMFLTFAPAQLGLYVTFCIYEVSNANWLFFSGVAVILSDTFFLAAWLDAVVAGIVRIERQVEGW